jgi:acetyl-CoA acetyltransferase
LDEYLAGKWINEPLRIFDCAFEVDGACAVVLTSLERARDLAQPVVRIVGGCDWSGSGGSWDQWPNLTEMFSARVGPRLWDSTHLRPADMDLACIYDCFTYTVMAVAEDFGFFPKGDAGTYFREGRATYGGDVVINPHGGLLSEGYLHGMNHHFEAVLQLRGAAGPRQVPDARLALVTAGAGPNGGAVVYATEDRM